MATEEEPSTQQYVRISDIDNEPQQWLTPIDGYDKKPVVSLEEAVISLVFILPTINDHVFNAKQRCKPQPDHGLTRDESASIILYTMSWTPRDQCLYFVLNRTLRTENREELKPWFLYLKLIITALSRLPSSTEKLIYRGIKLDLSASYLKNKKFDWWGLSSCTSSLEVLQRNQFLGTTGPRTLFNIECNGGKDISNHSRYISEKEIIILPGRQFQVKSCLQQSDLHIIHLKEIASPIGLLQLTKTLLQRLRSFRSLLFSLLIILFAVGLYCLFDPTSDSPGTISKIK
jgi:hypothetical protein